MIVPKEPFPIREEGSDKAFYSNGCIILGFIWWKYTFKGKKDFAKLKTLFVVLIYHILINSSYF